MTTTELAPELDSQRWLAESLRRTGLRQPAQLAFAQHPALHAIALRMCDYLTDRTFTVFAQRPILDGCIAAALTAYFREPEPTSSSASRFLRSLFSRAADVLSLEAICGARSWRPGGTESLRSFLEQHPSALLVPRSSDAFTPSPWEFRRTLALLLLTDEDQRALGVDPVEIARPPE